LLPRPLIDKQITSVGFPQLYALNYSFMFCVLIRFVRPSTHLPIKAVNLIVRIEVKAISGRET